MNSAWIRPSRSEEGPPRNRRDIHAPTNVACDDSTMEKRGWQTHWHTHPGVRSGAQLTLGERAADRMRNLMGSWPFVFVFFGIMISWAIANSAFYLGGQHGKHGFDPYPYILLNLFLSMLAGVQAAALLIAAKRADAISSEIAMHTERNTDDIKGLVNDLDVFHHQAHFERGHDGRGQRPANHAIDGPNAARECSAAVAIGSGNGAEGPIELAVAVLHEVTHVEDCQPTQVPKRLVVQSGEVC